MSGGHGGPAQPKRRRGRGERIEAPVFKATSGFDLARFYPRGRNFRAIEVLLCKFVGRPERVAGADGFKWAEEKNYVATDADRGEWKSRLDHIATQFNIRRSASGEVRLSSVQNSLQELKGACDDLSRKVRGLDSITLGLLAGFQSPGGSIMMRLDPQFREAFEAAFDVVAARSTSPGNLHNPTSYMQEFGPVRQIDALSGLAARLGAMLEEIYGQDSGGNGKDRDLSSEWVGGGFKAYLVGEIHDFVLELGSDYARSLVTSTLPSRVKGSKTGIFLRLLGETFKYATGVVDEKSDDDNFGATVRSFLAKSK